MLVLVGDGPGFSCWYAKLVALVGGWLVLVSVGPGLSSWRGHRGLKAMELVGWAQVCAFVSC